MEIRNLTEREMNVLKLLTQGLENSEIEQQMIKEVMPIWHGLLIFYIAHFRRSVLYYCRLVENACF